MNKPAGFNKAQIQQLEEVLDKKFKIELKPIHKKLNKLQDDLDTTINFFDRITVDHEVRIKNLENHVIGVV